MTFLKAISALALAGTLSVSALNAATIDLGLKGDATGHDQNTGTFSSGGITGTITAGCDYFGNDTDCDLSKRSDTPLIRISRDGMGVRSDRDSNDELDSSNSGEFLTFAFDSLVDITGISFAGLSGSNRYDLLVDGKSYATRQKVDPWTTLISGVSFLTIVADSGRFSVASLGVQVAPVPVPAAGGLMIAGLGALVALRRRRKA